MTVPFDARHRRIGEALFAAGLVVYFVALHLLLVDGRWPRITVTFVIAPWAVALASIAAHRLPRAAAGIAVVALTIGTWFATEWTSPHPEATLLFESVAFNLLLAGIFAASLFVRGDALVTRVARISRGDDMPPRVVAYTRVVTGAWSTFFVLCACTSTLLYFTVSRHAWSIFANLLYWPLLVAMFVGEYVVRRLVLRDVRHHSLMTAVRAYAQTHQKGLR